MRVYAAIKRNFVPFGPLWTGFLCMALLASCSNKAQVNATKEREAFMADLKKRTFNFFWDQFDESTFGIPDRYPSGKFTSIAATGAGLTSYIIGAENHYISRDEASDRVMKTLEWFYNSPQGADLTGMTGFKGFYYHFLTYTEGHRFGKTELSTIDTGLLMAGVLACQSYFDRSNSTETKIRSLADSLFRRVEWDWAMNGKSTMSMGYHPERGFIDAQWKGYNEAMILLIMAMGSPTHPIPADSWKVWCDTYEWAGFYGYEHVNFSPLFGHQYSHMYIDFKGIQDEYMREKGIDYFENSRRATLSNRAYCIDNPEKFNAYSQQIWGLTACDGPGTMKQVFKSDTVQFWDYRARGASSNHIVDDGTIAPTASGGSIPFAPEECLDALFTMKSQYGDSLYGEYGFRDAFNLSFQKSNGNYNWFDQDYLGIDQGPVLIQLENYQTGFITGLMKRNKYIINGLKKAGFKGGWLEKAFQPNPTVSDLIQ